MELARISFPGRRMLRRRVDQACGPPSALADLGHRFGDWLQSGSDAPPATVQAVETRLTGYLDAAAVAGRQWGFQAGLVAGGALLASVTVLSLLVWAVFG